MRLTQLLLASLLVLSTGAATAVAQTRLMVQGMLVTASNEPGKTDPRVAPYEPNLKRVLRFESYRHAGGGKLELGVPDNGRIDLGGGHRLQLESLSANAQQVRLRVRWFERDREVMNTVLALRLGTPAVLGGPARGADGEPFAVIVLVL